MAPQRWTDEMLDQQAQLDRIISFRSDKGYPGGSEP